MEVIKESNFNQHKGINFERVGDVSKAYGKFQGENFEFNKVGDIYKLDVKGKTLSEEVKTIAKGLCSLKEFSSKAKLQSRRRFRVLLKKLIKASN